MPRKPTLVYSHSVPEARKVTFTCETDGSTLHTTMMYIEEEHIPAIFSLIQQAAKEGYNVGVDEYHTQEALLEIIELGPVFVFIAETSTETKTGTLPDSKTVTYHDASTDKTIVGALLIPPALLVRSFRPHTCEFKIILSSHLEKRGGFHTMLRIAEGLLSEVPELLYDSSLISVFATNYDYMKAIRQERYYPGVVLPQIGWVEGQKRPQDSVIFYKDIREGVPVSSMCMVVVVLM